MENRITQVPPRAAKYYTRPSEPNDVTEPIKKSPRIVNARKRLFLPFLGGATIVLFIVLSWTWFVIPWWTGIQTQWHYGDAKVSTLTADVGHGGVSQLLAFDYQGQVTIIEIVGEKAILYKGDIFIGANRLNRVITLSLQDVNADGKPDVVIQIVGTEGETVLFNTGTSFSWTSK